MLPIVIQDWFEQKNWSIRPHQLELIKNCEQNKSTLLIAPTGAGKTLAGFLPSIIELLNDEAKGGVGPHTLYISPLKALAVDVARNLIAPIDEMGVDIIVETRTGDTPASKKRRQKEKPPHILMTTPEQLALLLSHQDAHHYFSNLKTVVLDELHSLSNSKRGDLLALGLARLRKISPELKAIGLSATVADTDALRTWLVAQTPRQRHLAELVEVKSSTKPNIQILETSAHLPWKGHTARYALPEIYKIIQSHKMVLIFVNTRFQAELIFQELWFINELKIPIALHHGSLDVSQRRRVESAMADGKIQAVVATSTLELGIDWGDVDLVIHIGAPKGASRLAQRIGRANHRMDEPSKAILVPANRFEVMECQAALRANQMGVQDAETQKSGALDVLAQHILCIACSGPFRKQELFDEITSSSIYAHIDETTFDRLVDFVAMGGYALRSYEQFAKIRETADGYYRLTHPQFAQQYRLNAGTIIEMPYLRLRLVRHKGDGKLPRGGPVIGKVEEYFLESLTRGDTFLFSGRILRYEGIRDNDCIVSESSAQSPKIPSYAGGKFPLSTYLAEEVRRILSSSESWNKLPKPVYEWLELQKKFSIIPAKNEILMETFPRSERHYLVAYPFEGRIAHQSLGMLLTRRLTRANTQPLGFVANDYGFVIWCMQDINKMVETGDLSIEEMFDEDMLGDDLDAWLAESWLLKRTFRQCALISGLVERRHPGKEKSGRQITVSTDLIYDVLREHEPDHILMQSTWKDASEGLLDIGRLGAMLKRIKGNIRHISLEKISPLSVPIMLEIGKEPVTGDTNDALLAEAADFELDAG